VKGKTKSTKNNGACLVYASNYQKIGFFLVLQSWIMVTKHFKMSGTYGHWVWDYSLPHPSKFLKVIDNF